MIREDLNGAFRVGGARPRGRVSWLITAVGYIALKPGVQSVLLYRAAHTLATRFHVPIVPWILYIVNFYLTCCDIGPRARIGAGFVIVHPGGVVVHGGTVAGANLCLFSGVVIGERFDGRVSGPPRIGRDVFIGTGAKVLGPILIGDGSVIGANAVVLRDVPAGHRAMGIPAINYPGSRAERSNAPEGDG